MDAYRIKGKVELAGEVSVSGSKNAALPILAATLVEEGRYLLKNVPELKDIRTMMKLLKKLGLTVNKIENNVYEIINNGIKSIEATYDLVKTMRASFLVMGPILAEAKKAKVSLPGGCAIGTRPVDLHLKGFQALGCEIEIKHGYVEASADKLHGNTIVLDFPSVGATENIIMAAVKAKGQTVLENAAKEPEIDDLCNFLNKMGAKISGVGTSRLEIDGVEKLTPCEHRIIPDRIEAGTFIILSVLSEGKIRVKNLDMSHLDGFKAKLEEMGVKFDITPDTVSVSAKVSELKPVRIKTMPYPGYPTDLQAQMMTLMALVKGTSEIHETIFENRFMHVPELNRMGADIQTDGKVAMISGGQGFSSAEIMASDLRAGASLVLAALFADGESIINRIYHIDRGYEKLENKLLALGADIERIKVNLI